VTSIGAVTDLHSHPRVAKVFVFWEGVCNVVKCWIWWGAALGGMWVVEPDAEEFGVFGSKYRNAGTGDECDEE
jgi:hypothetical protein